MTAEDPDPDDYRPKPLMGRTFWVMLVFGFLCVMAGIGVALLLPRLLPPKAEQSPVAHARSSAPATPAASGPTSSP